MGWLDLPLFDAPQAVAVPYASGSATSRAGAVQVQPKAQTQAAIILDLITARGPVTDRELVQFSGLPINVVTARRRALVLQNFVEAAGTRIGSAGVLNVQWVRAR